jgi:hypothetical protein
MLTRDDVQAIIGQALCGLATTAPDMAGRRHRCSIGSDAMAPGCIQRAVAGTECGPYRQAAVVMAVLEKNRALTAAIRSGYADAAPAAAE